jgi:NADH-quinone oxidoreductase subunit G
LQSALRAAAKTDKPIATVFSPWMTVEEAYMLAVYLRSLSSNVRIAMGPVRIVGEDDTYPKDVHGKPIEPVKFTIRAEKCPNRLGVQMVLDQFADHVVSLDELFAQAASGELAATYLVGGDPEGWITDDQAAALESVETVVVQDILPSAASQIATFVLPGGSFAERDGTFVNYSGLAQAINRAIRSPGEAKADNRVLWDLSGRTGLFNLTALRAEIAKTISGLQPFAVTPFPVLGISLEKHEFAVVANEARAT